MLKLLIGAALGFAAGAWFMDSQEGAQRRALIKDKAAGIAGKGGQPEGEGDSHPSATASEPIAQRDPASAPGSETFSQS